MELNEFTWDRTEDGTSIDLRINMRGDGSCQIQNLKNSDEKYETDSTRSAAEAMENLMSEPAH